MRRRNSTSMLRQKNGSILRKKVQTGNIFNKRSTRRTAGKRFGLTLSRSETSSINEESAAPRDVGLWKDIDKLSRGFAENVLEKWRFSEFIKFL